MGEIVDLGILADGGRIRNLSGKERGIEGRLKLKLDELDRVPGVVEIRIPDYLDMIAPSYFQGLFSQSIKALAGREGFLKKYRFHGSPQIMEWVNVGIRNATTSRAPLI